MLQSARFILLLNKFDIFSLKVGVVPLEEYFPDYEGGRDISKAVNYISAAFLRQNTKGVSLFMQLVISFVLSIC